MKKISIYSTNNPFKKSINQIDLLAASLTPVHVVTNLPQLASRWMLAALLFSIGIIHLAGPIRDTAMSQLTAYPLFALELIMGATAIALLTFSAFFSCVPGRRIRLFATAGLSLTALLVLYYSIGVSSPVIEPSLYGHRDHCVLEIYAYSTVPLILAAYMGKQLFTLEPMRSALLFGLTAGLTPALYMQIACMYSAKHALLFHLLPGATMAPIAAAVMYIYLKYRRDNYQREI